MIVTRHPAHLNSVRPVDLLNIPGFRHFDKCEPYRILWQIPKNSEDGRKRRFVSCQQIEIACIWQVKAAPLINESDLLTNSRLLRPESCHPLITMRHEIDI